MDQRRSRGRPTQTDGPDSACGRRLSRLVSRRADLSEGANQGSSYRRRAPRSSCAFSDPTWTCSAPRQRRFEAAIADVPGVQNLKVEPQVLVPQLEVRVRPDAAARLGLTPGNVRRAVATLVNGTKVGEIYQDQKSFDVVVRGVPKLRERSVGAGPIADRSPTGGHVASGGRGRFADRRRHRMRSNANGHRAGST